ncbi:unnamed protein product [Protopolystoma xenopodis]|uniref:Uncharacterized protein n=1 Tax=Protopolystoma xenopodis TaxID=117903 RepID=A0A448WNZ8_9PLAT|nr:unnamed protein product [Protopolystoma xenopodis]
MLRIQPIHTRPPRDLVSVALGPQGIYQGRRDRGPPLFKAVSVSQAHRLITEPTGGEIDACWPTSTERRRARRRRVFHAAGTKGDLCLVTRPTDPRSGDVEDGLDAGLGNGTNNPAARPSVRSWCLVSRPPVGLTCANLRCHGCRVCRQALLVTRLRPRRQPTFCQLEAIRCLGGDGLTGDSTSSTGHSLEHAVDGACHHPEERPTLGLPTSGHLHGGLNRLQGEQPSALRTVYACVCARLFEIWSARVDHVRSTRSSEGPMLAAVTFRNLSPASWRPRRTRLSCPLQMPVGIVAFVLSEH